MPHNTRPGARWSKSPAYRKGFGALGDQGACHDGGTNAVAAAGSSMGGGGNGAEPAPLLQAATVSVAASA